ncbi:hypothetical protein BD408DRAFT_410130, partial [Parasitella parasitica]
MIIASLHKNEEVSDICPDAVIATIIQSQYGCPLSFGEGETRQLINKQAPNIHGYPLPSNVSKDTI